MGNRQETRIILGSLRYKSAPDTNLMVNVPLIQTSKENVEFDRNINIDLQQVFDDERQSSDTFRPACKFTLLFQNAYTGSTNYTPLENNLYYVNEKVSALNQCSSTPQSVSWSGFPQYNEFDFIRTDYDVTGYTQPPNQHLVFIPKSASSYNWNFYMSYPFENDYTKQLEAIEKKFGQTLQWVCGDGIPFVVDNTTFKGQNIVSFRCPMKHGLSTGEFVNLSFSYNGNSIFQVYSLGDGYSGSEEYIFNLFNVGFTGGTFSTYTEGTFKRIVNIENSGDTMSTYYIRKHKILTNPEDAVLAKAAFDQNIFGSKKKFESSGYTPTREARVSIKEGAQSYTLTFNTDISINPIRDNHKRPITELFFTTIWRGYFGYMFGVQKPNGLGYEGIKEGFEFNLPLDPNTNNPSDWWRLSNSKSDTSFQVLSYTTPQGSTGGPANGPIPFTYIKSLVKDDVLDGDFCEWNESEQKERVISDLYHKLTYNPFVFKVNIPNQSPTNRFGFYYKPHNSIQIRSYSDYIESGNKQNTVGVPDYAYYYPTTDTFIWRDIYPYGFISNGIGVNYPFMNGKHYPYQDIIFRIIPEGTNYIEQFVINDPIEDPCE